MGIAGGTAAMLTGAGRALAETHPVPGTFSATPHSVSVTDYFDNLGVNPATAGVRTAAQAKINTEAFRNACASAMSDYNQLPCPIEVYVPAGDWYLWEGFTVPLGCTLRGAGPGATRLIISAAINRNPATPIISLGSVLAANPAGQKISATEPAVFITPNQQGYRGVPHNGMEGALSTPCCVAQDLMLYTGNGTGIDVQTAGWVIKNIWLIARDGIIARNDGIISGVVVDSSSTSGILFEGGQDILIDNLYVYNSPFGIQFSGNNDNIRFSNTQICFPKNTGIAFNPNSVSNNILFEGLSLLGNSKTASPSFFAGVNNQGASTNLTINNGLFSNLAGYALYGGGPGASDNIKLNHCTFDGRPSNARIGKNSNTGGIVYGHIDLLELNDCRFLNLNQYAVSLGLTHGTTPLRLIWNGGLIQNCVSADTSPVQVTRQEVEVYVSLANVTSLDAVPLFHYVAHNDAGHATGRFMNCTAPSANRDITWISQNAPALFATRPQTS